MPQYSRTETRRRTRRRAREMLALYLFLAAALAVMAWMVTVGWLDGGSPEPAFRDASPPAVSSPSPGGDGTGSGTDRAAASGPDGRSAVSGTDRASAPGTGLPAEAGADRPGMPGTEPSPSAGEDATPSPDGNGGTVTIALVGDILPAGRVAEAMNREGADYPFRKARDLLQSADIAAGNLETPVTTRGVPARNKQYVFRASPDHVPALREAGFDVLSLANNHSLDQGWEGLEDTIAHLKEAGLAPVGAGANEREAFAPVLIERNGVTVAFIGLSRVVPDVSWKAGPNHPGVAETYDTRRAVAAIREAKKRADLVVVMVHWGKERQDWPEPYQRKMGREFIDAGADLVIGSHAHVLQGLEPYKGKWIVYSLGNFVFTTAGVSKTQETGVLMAECGKNGDCRLTFHPMFAANFQPVPMKPEDAQRLLKRLEAVSYGVAIDADGAITVSAEAVDAGDASSAGGSSAGQAPSSAAEPPADGAAPSPAAPSADAGTTSRAEPAAGAPQAKEGR